MRIFKEKCPNSRILLIIALISTLVLSTDGDAEDDEDDETPEPTDGVVSQDDEGDLDSVRFLLYPDARKTDKYVTMQISDMEALKSSGFDASKPTKVLIHGFRSAYNSSFPQNVKNAFLATQTSYNYNILVVDWGRLAIPHATDRQYPRAVRNVPRVGELVAEFILWLMNDAAVSLSDVHIIGHSLGAHVSGDAGYQIQQKRGQKVARITGLDPAGPEFHPQFEGTRRLHSTDADYVDVMHTNAGKLGIFENIGQVDFWVNGGTGPQPGCRDIESRKGLQQLLSGSCSHRMATEFFANTIRNEETQPRCACGSRIKYTVEHSCCDRRAVFGEFSPAGTTGKYYLSYKISDYVTPESSDSDDDGATDTQEDQ